MIANERDDDFEGTLNDILEIVENLQTNRESIHVSAQRYLSNYALALLNQITPFLASLPRKKRLFFHKHAMFLSSVLNETLKHVESRNHQVSSIQKRSRSPSPLAGSNRDCQSDLNVSLVHLETGQPTKKQKIMASETTKFIDQAQISNEAGDGHQDDNQLLIPTLQELDTKQDKITNQSQNEEISESESNSNDVPNIINENEEPDPVQVEKQPLESVSDSEESANGNQLDIEISCDVKSQQIEYWNGGIEGNADPVEKNADEAHESEISAFEDDDSKTDEFQAPMKAQKDCDNIEAAEEITSDSEIEEVTYDNDDSVSEEFHHSIKSGQDKFDATKNEYEITVTKDQFESKILVENGSNESENQSRKNTEEKDLDTGLESVQRYENIATKENKDSNEEEPKEQASNETENVDPQNVISQIVSTQEIIDEKLDNAMEFTQESEEIPNSYPFITQLPVLNSHDVNSERKKAEAEPHTLGNAINLDLIPKKSILKSTSANAKSAKKNTRVAVTIDPISGSNALSPCPKFISQTPSLAQEVSKPRGLRNSRSFQSLSEITIQNVRNSISSNTPTSKLHKVVPFSSKSESESDVDDSDDDSFSSSEDDSTIAPIRSAKELRKKKKKRKSMLLRLADDVRKQENAVL